MVAAARLSLTVRSPVDTKVRFGCTLCGAPDCTTWCHCTGSPVYMQVDMVTSQFEIRQQENPGYLLFENESYEYSLNVEERTAPEFCPSLHDNIAKATCTPDLQGTK